MSYFMPGTPSYPVSGFGLDISTPKGIVSVGTTGYNHCGSLAGTQQMLADLGLYTAVVDGLSGPATNAAFQAFADQHGINLSGGVPDRFCEQLIAVWQAQMGAPPPETTETETPLATTTTKYKFTLSPAALRRVKSSKMLPTFPTTNGQNQGDNGSALGPLDKTKMWWGSQSTGTKVAMGMGVAAGAGLLIYALIGGGATKPSPTYAANRRR